MSPIQRHHIVVATPCYGGNVTCPYTISLIGLQKACLQLGIGISFRLIGGDALITRARNILVQQFLSDTTATHLLFIDADIGFSAEQALALLDADKDIAGSIYPLKQINFSRVKQHMDLGAPHPESSALNYVVDLLNNDQVPDPKDGFVRVRYIGTGFMMIRREVFTRMADHYPDIHFKNIHIAVEGDLANRTNCAYFDCIIDKDTGTYLSEDYTFCKRWTDMGGEIWANTQSKLSHTGPMTFDGDLGAALEIMAKTDNWKPPS